MYLKCTLCHCFIAAHCDEEMVYEYTYPKTPSSNGDEAESLSEKNSADKWSPDANDKNPSVTITVDDEDTFIDSVKVDVVDKVDKIIVYVIDDAGAKASHIYIFMIHVISL